MKRFVSLFAAVCVAATVPTAVSAEYIGVTKITDAYALRENGELVKYREAENNLPQRVAVGVVDFNNSAYVTADGGLYAMDGQRLADGAKSVVESAVYVDGVYNGEYAYIAADGSLRLPAVGGYAAAKLCDGVADVHGNMVLRSDGTAAALLAGSGTSMSVRELVSGAKGIYGEDGEYLVLDEANTCWFVPLLKGAFAYSYEKLKLDENVTSCNSLDSVIIGSEWSEYDRSALRAGKVAKSLKLTNALFVYGDCVYINTGRSFGVWYNKENNLMQNSRAATQLRRGSMDGYVLDQADTLYRNVQEGNNLTSTEVAFPMYSIELAGDGFCIARTQDGLLYGVDKAVGFGTGLIDGNTAVTSVMLPISQKPTDCFLNGEKITLTRRIIDKEERTLYPMREIAELLGAKVDWDENSKSATATLGDKTVKFTVNQSAYEVNGEKKNMDTVPIIDELTQSTYIPLRFTAEALGFGVEWSAGQYADSINIVKQ